MTFSEFDRFSDTLKNFSWLTRDVMKVVYMYEENLSPHLDGFFL